MRSDESFLNVSLLSNLSTLSIIGKHMRSLMPAGLLNYDPINHNKD